MNLLPSNERSYKETGVNGVLLCVLWDNETNGGAALVRMNKGSTFPLHSHPGWEQLFVISGNITIADKNVTKGDYLFTNPGETHSVNANDNSELLIFSEKGIEIIE